MVRACTMRRTWMIAWVVGLCLLAAGCSVVAAAAGASGRRLRVLVLLPRESPADAADVSALQLGMVAELAANGGRAGGYGVRLLSGSTSDPLLGTEDPTSCPQIAQGYASSSAAVAVIGPLTDQCGAVISSFDGLGVAVVSPTVDDPVFTHMVGRVGTCNVGGPTGIDLFGCEPAAFYPAGVRNFSHVTATSDMQGAAAAWQLARLGVRRVFVVEGDGVDPWLGPPFRREARVLGLRLVGVAAPIVSPSISRRAVRRLVARILGSGARAVAFLGYDADPAGRDRGIAPILTSLRARGFRGPFVGAFDGPTQALVQLAPHAIQGMYYMSVRLPLEAMGPAAQRFAARLRLTGRRAVDAVYGAVAIQLVLAAIADSDGTRAGVRAALMGLRARTLIGVVRIDGDGDPVPERVAIFQVEHHTFAYRRSVLVGPTQ